MKNFNKNGVSKISSTTVYCPITGDTCKSKYIQFSRYSISEAKLFFKGRPT